MLDRNELIVGPAEIPDGYIAVPSDFYEILIDQFHRNAAEAPLEYAVGKFLEMFSTEG